MLSFVLVHKSLLESLNTLNILSTYLTEESKSNDNTIFSECAKLDRIISAFQPSRFTFYKTKLGDKRT